MKKSFISILLLLLIMSSTVFAKTFLDLNEDHWAYVPIEQMKAKGIINGYPDGTFKPENNVTRVEFAKILVASFNLTEKSNYKFEDLDENYWGYDYIQIASNYLSAFVKDNKMYYMPDEAAVREDITVAVVIAANLENAKYDLSTLDRFSDKDLISNNLKKYVAIAVENNLMHGNANGTFNPKGKLTRAEISQVISNVFSELEKIPIQDIEKVDKLPTFKFDRETQTVDLGKDWKKYGYFVASTLEEAEEVAKGISFYKPAQRVLTKNAELYYKEISTNRGAKNYFTYNYLIISLLSDKSKYQIIDVINYLPNFEYDKVEKTVDLGEDWKNYVFNYADTWEDVLHFDKIYTPSKRYLTKDELKADSTTTNKKSYFKGNCLAISYKTDISSSDINVGVFNYHILDVVEKETVLPTFKFDRETQTVDLGKDYEKYEYMMAWSESEAKKIAENPFGSYYKPTQRVLKKDGELFFKEYLTKIKRSFYGNHLIVFLSNDRSIYQIVDVKNILPDFKYDEVEGTVDLGKDWKKYVFSYADTLEKAMHFDKIYTPAKRVLTKDELKADSETNNIKSYFKGKYLTITYKTDVIGSGKNDCTVLDVSSSAKPNIKSTYVNVSQISEYVGCEIGTKIIEYNNGGWVLFLTYNGVTKAFEIRDGMNARVYPDNEIYVESWFLVQALKICDPKSDFEGEIHDTEVQFTKTSQFVEIGERYEGKMITLANIKYTYVNVSQISEYVGCEIGTEIVEYNNGKLALFLTYNGVTKAFEVRDGINARVSPDKEIAVESWFLVQALKICDPKSDYEGEIYDTEVPFTKTSKSVQIGEKYKGEIITLAKIMHTYVNIPQISEYVGWDIGTKIVEYKNGGWVLFLTYNGVTKAFEIRDGMNAHVYPDKGIYVESWFLVQALKICDPKSDYEGEIHDTEVPFTKTSKSVQIGEGYKGEIITLAK